MEDLLNLEITNDLWRTMLHGVRIHLVEFMWSTLTMSGVNYDEDDSFH